MSDQAVSEGGFETDIPARMDRLPWASWHMRIITALGTSWLLDGLEVTPAGPTTRAIQSKNGLGLSDAQVSLAATIYLAGSRRRARSLVQSTLQEGRRKLFLITLAT